MKTVRFVLVAVATLLVSPALTLIAASQPDLVYYVGTDQHVHELRFGGSSWQTTDLMVATGATNAASGSALTGHVYGTSDNVFYIATDQHVHEIAFYNSAWHTGDVTAAAGASNAATGSAITSHVLDRATTFTILLQTEPSTNWPSTGPQVLGTPSTLRLYLEHQTLSRAAPLTSEVYPNNNAENIFFVAGDHSPDMWFTEDVTLVTGALNAIGGSDLTSHVFGNSDNLWYIATDQHVHGMALLDNTWQTSDITKSAGAPNPITGSSLASNVNGGTDDAYFINPDPHVNQLYDVLGAWHSVDVTALGGGPNPASGTGMASHVYGTAENVFFFAADEHVHELAFYSNSWHNSDPTALAGAPAATIAEHDLIGFVGL